jgi:hypothetical protein
MSGQGEEPERLLSGTFLVQHAGDATRSLGLVSGETPPTGDGFVQLSLDASSYIATFAHGLSLRLSEPIVRSIAERMLETCARLVHLRALHRLGKLGAARPGVHPGGRWQEAAPPLPEATSGLELIQLPEPAEEPSVVWLGGTGKISYRSREQTMVSIRIEGLRSIRSCKGMQSSSVRRGRSQAPDVTAEAGAARDEEDPLEQFVFTFPVRSYEVIALSFVLEP